MKLTSRYAWLLLVAGGLVLIVLGIYSILYPLPSYLRFVRYAGLVLLINSTFLLAFAFIAEHVGQERYWLLTESILNFSFGLLLSFNPLLTFISFPILAGMWMLLLGILKAIGGLVLRTHKKGSMFIFYTGMLFILFGMAMIRAPYGSAASITILFGVFGLTMGSLYVYDSFRLRRSITDLEYLF